MGKSCVSACNSTPRGSPSPSRSLPPATFLIGCKYGLAYAERARRPAQSAPTIYNCPAHKILLSRPRGGSDNGERRGAEDLQRAPAAGSVLNHIGCCRD